MHLEEPLSISHVLSRTGVLGIDTTLFHIVCIPFPKSYPFPQLENLHPCHPVVTGSLSLHVCLLCYITNKVIVSVNLAVIWHRSAEINGIHTKMGRHANFNQICDTVGPDLYHFSFSTKMEGKNTVTVECLKTLTVHIHIRMKDQLCLAE